VVANIYLFSFILFYFILFYFKEYGLLNIANKV